MSPSFLLANKSVQLLDQCVMAMKFGVTLQVEKNVFQLETKFLTKNHCCPIFVDDVVFTDVNDRLLCYGQKSYLEPSAF